MLHIIIIKLYTYLRKKAIPISTTQITFNNLKYLPTFSFLLSKLGERTKTRLVKFRLRFIKLFIW